MSEFPGVECAPGTVIAGGAGVGAAPVFWLRERHPLSLRNSSMGGTGYWVKTVSAVFKHGRNLSAASLME